VARLFTALSGPHVRDFPTGQNPSETPEKHDLGSRGSTPGGSRAARPTQSGEPPFAMDDVVRLPRYILTSTVPEQSVHSSQLIPVGAGVPQLGELVAGKYRIEGTLGVGGMGVVLAARNELIGQSVAIKFLVVNDEEYLGEATQRLLR
jgi:serine/threonine protein kinase